MNEKIDAILKRRSVREFLPKQIGQQELGQIIEAGLWAPSARNLQTPHITAVKDKGLIDEINEATRGYYISRGEPRVSAMMSQESYHVLFNAPCVLIVSCDPKEKWGPVDCGLSGENICLAAQALGIGSCIIGFVTPVFASTFGAEVTRKLELPEGFAPQFAVALGYPSAQAPQPKERIPGRVNYIG